MIHIVVHLAAGGFTGWLIWRLSPPSLRGG
jgi:hypothetical protein